MSFLIHHVCCCLSLSSRPPLSSIRLLTTNLRSPQMVPSAWPPCQSSSLATAAAWTTPNYDSGLARTPVDPASGFILMPGSIVEGLVTLKAAATLFMGSRSPGPVSFYRLYFYSMVLQRMKHVYCQGWEVTIVVKTKGKYEHSWYVESLPYVRVGKYGFMDICLFIKNFQEHHLQVIRQILSLFT